MDWIDRFFLSVLSLMMLSMVALLIGLGVAGTYQATGGFCKDMGQRMGVETSYKLGTGCMYKLGDQWIPEDMVTAAERNGKVIFVPKNTHRLDVQMGK
jgi:hypothetical protein